MKSKRKIFICCVASLMMALIMAVPASVSATTTYEAKDEASFLTAIENAVDGDVITVSGSITCNSAVNIDKDVTITGGSINFTNASGNSLTILNGANVTLSDITVSNTSGKYVIQVYGEGASLTGSDIVINHGGTSGAPLLINSGATANINGLTMKLNSGSWYGVNVDSSTATLENVSVNGALGDTQSVICAEDDAEVVCSDFTKVETAKHEGAAHTQIAYVEDSNLAQFVVAKTTAGADITDITLQEDVELTAPLFLNEAMDVNGKGFTINGTDRIGKENVVTVTADGVTLDNVVIKTSAANKSALHVYKTTDTVLKDMILDNSETAGGAGLIVNGAKVEIQGSFDLILGENSWGGINVDTDNGDSEVVFADGATVTATAPDGKDIIYQDAGQEDATITGAEAAGLVKNEDGSYAMKEDPSTTPDDPAGTPGDKADGTQNANGSTPKTSDDMNLGLTLAIMGMAAVAAAGTVIYGRRRRSN